ncbi:MAG: hypothetical protein U0792_09665 [Gemmataceae bacterium]
MQRLLIPEPIDLPAEQAAIVLEAADALKELGLEVSDFEGNTILLSSYPTLLGRKPPHEIFQGVVDHLLTKERPPTREAMLHLLMATMACKAAVKADRLTRGFTCCLQLAEDSCPPFGRPRRCCSADRNSTNSSPRVTNTCHLRREACSCYASAPPQTGKAG